MSPLESLQENWWFGWLMALVFFIIQINHLIDAFWRFIRWIRPQPKMTKDVLRKAIQELIEDISRFMVDRQNRDPTYSRISTRRPDEDEQAKLRKFLEQAEDSSKYHRETMSQFTANFLQRIAAVREELAQRGIEDPELERNFQHRVNTFSINFIITSLAEMSAKI